MKQDRHELATMLAIAVVFAIGCVFLGRWQYHRFEAKYAADHLVGRNYRAAPAALDRLVPAGSTALPHAREWRSVRVVGVYDAGRQVLVRNRPFGGAYGYEVLAPLEPVAGGPSILIDRGWIPSGQDADAPDQVPSAPSGQVTVVAHLRPSEADKTTGTLPDGQFESIDLDRIAAATGDALLPAYGVLASEVPASTPAPALLPEPDDGGYWGVNLSYAFQWGLFGVAALVLPFVFVRRRRALRLEDEAAEVSAAADVGSEVVRGAADGDWAGRTKVKAKVKKVRIWDEEDE